MVSKIKPENILVRKISEKEANLLVSFVKAEVHSKFDDQKSYFASKEDIANSKVNMIIMNVHFLGWATCGWIMFHS